MANNANFCLFLIWILFRTEAISFNQPKFCPSATWYTNAITFAAGQTNLWFPFGIFVDVNNSVYITSTTLGLVGAWVEGRKNISRTISGGLSYPYNVFVTENGDIYVDNGDSNRRVDKWTLNSTNSTAVMTVAEACRGLFVDSNNTLYCSMYFAEQVMKKSLNTGYLNDSVVAAGDGTSGALATQFLGPHGIFVDSNFTLYVADFHNMRIQRFFYQQLNGTTVAGNGAPSTITLYGPTGVILDADGYLYIVDNPSNRIIGSGPNGFRCLMGCSGPGSTDNTLLGPRVAAFDSYGNLYVTDSLNNRVQIFPLATNSCVLSYNQPSLCLGTSWKSYALTVADNSTIGTTPTNVFVDGSNAIYVATQTSGLILIWPQGADTPITINTTNTSTQYALAVSISGDMYVSTNISNGQVNRWTKTSLIASPVMNVGDVCRGLFFDSNDTLYCSTWNFHSIVSKNLWINSSVSFVAGNGVNGSAANQLNTPYGIFVDSNFVLYVADMLNNRIQRFSFGQSNAVTIAGDGSTPPSINLLHPSGIVVDANGYFYITDRDNNRVVVGGPVGFRCAIGCSGSGSGNNQLNQPQALSFDSYGNIYVADTNNNRILKFILATNSCTVSYNQPQFCANATWNQAGTTLANVTTIGYSPVSVFVHTSNVVYAPSFNSTNMQIWFQDSTIPITTNISDSVPRLAVFVTVTGELYISNGAISSYVNRHKWNQTNDTSNIVMNGSCYGIFVDIDNTLYCSLGDLHRIVCKSLDNLSNPVINVAGTGSSGFSSDMLNRPRGLFVDLNFTLYVADWYNDRIQTYLFGQLNGTTVAGNGSSSPGIALNFPTNVILDGDGYLFILDAGNSRVIGQSSNGFRCLIGCTGSGSGNDQLNSPLGMSFDSDGNIYVADTNNNRIQKFTFDASSCNAALDITSQSSDTSTTASASVFSSMSTSTSGPTTSYSQTSTNANITTTLSIGTTVRSPALTFVPFACSNSNWLGSFCNISTSICDVLRPCQNGGSCINNQTLSIGYLCACPIDFYGTQCQWNSRLCQTNTCWNGGQCNETSNTTFICLCQQGWQDEYCETKINYCDNVTCLNGGVCRPLLMNYTCECLGDSYSGRHCEIQTSKTRMHTVIAKSFAYIAIIAMTFVVLFIITMDVLKYGFGIDPARQEIPIKKVKKRNRFNKLIIMVRYIYVNHR